MPRRVFNPLGKTAGMQSSLAFSTAVMRHVALLSRNRSLWITRCLPQLVMTRRAYGAAHLQHLLQRLQELRGRCSVATRCKEPGVVQGGVPPSRHAICQPLPKGDISQSHPLLDSNMPIMLQQVSYNQQQMPCKPGQAVRRHLSIPHGVGILQPCCNRSQQSSSRQ